MDRNNFDIDHARKFFLSMGCSHFHMARENSVLFKQYTEMGISKEIEYGWMKSSFFCIYNQIMYEVKNEEVIFLFDQLVSLAIKLSDDNVIDQVVNAATHLSIVMPLSNRVIISEIINGGNDISYRNGIIFTCFDKGKTRQASDLGRLSIYFAQSEKLQAEDELKLKRIDKAIEKASKILINLELNEDTD